MSSTEEPTHWHPGQRIRLRTAIGRIAPGTIGRIIAIDQRNSALMVAFAGHEAPSVVGMEEAAAAPPRDDGDL